MPAISWFIFKVFFESVRKMPDVIICAHINYAPLGFAMKRLFRRNYIVCTHGIDVWDIKSSLQLKALREAKLITTVAEYTRDRIVDQLPEVRERIYLLYNPVDGDRFVPSRKPPSLAKRLGVAKKKVIFTVARLSAIEGYKGYDRVIQAMPKVLAAVPEAFYVLGGAGDDAPRVHALIEGTGLRDSVRMVGYIPDEEIVNYYNLADVFIMPSKAEGAPAVFVEALACGVPVIAGNQDGSATPLLHGEVGLLIDPDNINEISRAIIRVLTGKVRKNLRDRAFLRRKVLGTFGLDHFPGRVDDVLRIVSSGPVGASC